MRSGKRPGFLVGAAIFALTFILFSFAPVVDNADSRYSMALSESLLHSHTSHLNGISFPAPIATLTSSAPPIDDPGYPDTYQLGKVNGNVVYLYPGGSSILSIPFVGLMNALGISATTPDHRYNVGGEILIQKVLAALLMASLASIVFATASLFLKVPASVVIALGLAIGTQVFSTATRALWSHSWFILLGGLVVYQLASVEVAVRRIRPIVLATILSWMYFTRPTGAIAIVCVSVYLFAYYREAFLPYAVTGALWFGGFVVYSWSTYGGLIPGYYRSRFDLHHFLIGIYANLLSPSRGLLVYVPTLLLVTYLLGRYWREVPARRLAIVSISAITMTLVAIACYPCWWGGGSYGPRLMTDTLPWLALLAILGCAAAATKRSYVLSGPEFAAATILLALSVAINARGAFSVYAHHVWNLEMAIDHHPERAFDWSYPQFAAGLIKPPAYVTWRFPAQPAAAKTSSDLALSNGHSSLNPATARRAASR